MSENLIPKQFLDRMQKLSDREEGYFRAMWPKSGVLYITAQPGVAKSAIARSIADKMEFRYMDIRLSMVDETDVGLYPNVSDIHVKDHTGEKNVKCLDFVVPRWAIEANKQPTIIHFEELNRASQQVRNAALQILLERQIGVDFKFNDNVLMMASGNLGDEDHTDVEEFDSALNNRLIHVKHSLPFDEWKTNFAEGNVHKIIISFLTNYTENFLGKKSENTAAYASPRSWTFLSDFIISNFGKDSSPSDFLPMVKKMAPSYVGTSAAKFIQYCDEMLRININDILNRYSSVKSDLEKVNRDKKSELMQAARELELDKLKPSQLDNLSKFLKTCGQDELTGYLTWVVDKNSNIQKPEVKSFLLTFKEELLNIKRLSKGMSN